VLEGQEIKVCKLKEIFVCLEQAPRQWNGKFKRTLTYVALLLIKPANMCTTAMVRVRGCPMFVCVWYTSFWDKYQSGRGGQNTPILVFQDERS
jgi:hypothetical protein